ncbi:MAG TPA: GldG family protein [Candidatus Dormibacteraeota bacterium]
MKLDRVLAVVLAVAGIGLLVAATVLTYLQTGPSPRYLLIFAAACLIGAAILEPSFILGIAGTRRGRTGAWSTALTVVVLGALAFLNVFASRGLQHVDLSASQLHSLTPKSRAVLAQLHSDLDVIAFAAPSDANRSTLMDLLNQYQDASSRVKVRFVDPNSDVAEAQALGVTSSGSLVLQYAGRRPVVLSPGSQTEQDVTGGILKLELNRTLVLCWAAGEGERDLQSTDSVVGYSEAAHALAGDDFEPRQLVLSQEAAVPAECGIVAIVGATSPLSAAAQGVLKTYVAAGGRLFIATDPWRSDVNDALNAVLQPDGLKFDGGLVIDDAAHSASNRPAIPLVVSYAGSPITKDLRNQVTLFPVTTSVSGGGTPLASSSAAAYEIPAPRQTLARQPGDGSGPFTFMSSWEQVFGNGARSRVVLSGSSALAQNQVVPPATSTVNLELFLSSMDWLAGQDSLIALPAKPSGSLPLSLTAEQVNLDVLISLILLPLAVAGGGFLIWLYRRRT